MSPPVSGVEYQGEKMSLVRRRLQPGLVGALILILACVAWPSLAQQNPNAAPAFKPEGVYDFGGIDQVSLFSGGLSLTIPIGQTYSTNGGLSYQLTAQYSSSAWDSRLEPVEQTGSNPDTWALGAVVNPKYRNNAGYGWRVSLGELIPYDDFYAPQGNSGQVGHPVAGSPPVVGRQWTYLSQDGGEHTFYDKLHRSDPHVNGVQYSRDGSYLRLKWNGSFEDPSSATVEFPNGEIHTFTRYLLPHDTGSHPQNDDDHYAYRLTEIKDASDNSISITYDPNGFNWWRINDGYRTHTVYLANQGSAFNFPKYLVDRVEMACFGCNGSESATYQFEYATKQILRPQDFPGIHDYPMHTRQIDVKVLTDLILPDGSRYCTGNGRNCSGRKDGYSGAQGVLKRLNLPTLGQLEWSWDLFLFPKQLNQQPGTQSPEGWEPHNLNQVVYSRRWVEEPDAPNPNDRKISEWIYDRDRDQDDDDGGVPPDYFPHEMVVMVTTPDKDLNRHYFMIYPADYPNEPPQTLGSSLEEYSLPYTRKVPDPRTAGGTRYLSSETYDCPTAGCILDAVDPIYSNLDVATNERPSYRPRSRKTYLSYELDVNRLPHDGFGMAFNRNRRVKSSRVVYFDDGGKYVQTDNSNFDGLGHYRFQRTDPSFGTTPMVDNFVDYNSGGGSYPGVISIPPKTARWILNSYASTRKTQWDGSGGRQDRHTKTAFDNRGRLICQRILGDDDGVLAKTDVMRLFAYGVGGGNKGNLVTETWDGAFNGTLSTNPATPCTGSLGSNTFRMEHSYQYGQRSKSRYTEENGSVSGGSTLDFYVLDRSIDWRTGLPTSTRDSTGLETEYEFDKQGRLTKIMPEAASGAAWRFIDYNKAVGGARAKIIIDDRENQGGASLAHEEYLYDGLGRLSKEKRKMPTATGSADSSREYAYHKGGNLLSTTVWSFGSSPHKTKYLNYDAWGRYRRIQQPDADEITDPEELGAIRERLGIGPEDDFFTPHSHDIDFAYKGIRQVERNRYVGIDQDNPWEPVTEDQVRTLETYDGFGRLTQMEEASNGDSASLVSTLYTYDVGDHLVESKQKIPGGSDQYRRWTWDQRDFMIQECPPEKNACTFNGAIDAMGNVGRHKDGDRDVRIIYDRAGRLKKVRRKQTPMNNLKVFIYGSSSHGDWARGKLLRTRYSQFLDIDDGNGEREYRVVQDYQYHGVGGRPSQKRTTLLRHCLPGDGEPDCDTSDWITETAYLYKEDYDPLGNRKTMHYPTCIQDQKHCPNLITPPTVNYNYKDGFLTSISGWAPSITYHDNQMLASVLHQNGVRDTYGKDEHGMPRVRSIKVTGNSAVGTPLDTGIYRYDGSGNIIQIGLGANEQHFKYDRVNRLRTAYVKSSLTPHTQLFTYDIPGNMTSIKTDNAPTRFLHPVTTTNRLPAPAAYDAAGNVIQWRDDDNTFTTFEYDMFNRLNRRWVDGRNRSYFLYDLDGERYLSFNVVNGAGKQSIVLRDFAGKPLREFNFQNRGNGTEVIPVKENIYLGNTILASKNQLSPVAQTYEKVHYSVDHLGSPRAITAGQWPVRLLTTHDYYPFGEEITDPNKDNLPMKFTGHERDTFRTGINNDFGDDLDYMHARFSSPFKGRFLSVDPVGVSPKKMRNPQSWNRYSYTVNNPMNLLDPDGRADMGGMNWRDPLWNALKQQDLTVEQRDQIMKQSALAHRAGLGLSISVGFGSVLAAEMGTAALATEATAGAQTKVGFLTKVKDWVGSLLPRANGAQLGRKLEYLLGNATGNAHNISRSTSMLRQLQQIGLQDNPATRSLLARHFDGVVRSTTNILRTQSNGRVVRESLLAGPNGVLKVQSVWEDTKLITVTLLGGS